METTMEEPTQEHEPVDPHVYVKSLIAENYNEHKNEKNKHLSWTEVHIVCISQEDSSVRYFATTNRNDGLLYEVVMFDMESDGTSKSTLFLYNRIARKFIEKGDNA